jgi:dihydroxyacetone kinase-like protein
MGCMIMVGLETISRWISRSAAVLEENRDLLTRLDAELGDADHGVNMGRGFRKVILLLDREWQDIGALLKQVGMTLISTVGGASGPLYGSFFLRAGETVAGKRELDTGDLADLFRGGTEAVMARGRARPGEKTMVDALLPAAEAIEAAAHEGSDPASALDRAAREAQRGAERTIPMQARKGRASYLGERSIGHKDPGAASSVLIVHAFSEAVASPN